jgi:phage shock protein E
MLSRLLPGTRHLRSGTTGVAVTLWLQRHCQTASSSTQASTHDSLSSFLQQRGVVLLDVRSRDEFAQGSARHARTIPMQSIPDLMHELPEDLAAPVVVFCAAGKRASLAKTFLQQVGYGNVVNGGSVGEVVDAQAPEPQASA